MDRKLYDAVMGLAIGDALGVPYALRPRGHFTCTGMNGFGTYGRYAGTWSDATSLTIATMASLKKYGGKVVPGDMMANFRDWLTRGMFTAGGDPFDAGKTTTRAIQDWKPGRGEMNNGSGSLMRVLPLAFCDCTDDDVRDVSAITHGHWIAKEACVIYVNVAARLLEGEKIRDIIHTLDFEKPFDRLKYADTMVSGNIRSGGYVVDTLEAALWAVSHEGTWEKGFRNDVLCAVNLGWNTDTIGAVTGGLAGIIYGVGDAVDWVESLQNRQELTRWMW